MEGGYSLGFLSQSFLLVTNIDNTQFTVEDQNSSTIIIQGAYGQIGIQYKFLQQNNNSSQPNEDFLQQQYNQN